MKYLVSLLIIFASTTVISSQALAEPPIIPPEDYQYEPLVREGVEWEYCWRQGNSTDPVPGTGVFYLRFDGKTEINGKSYNVCYRYESPDFKKEEAQIAGYAREEGHKVYAIISQLPNGRPYATDMREDLIYDFDASANDIAFSGLQIKDVRFVPINGTWRKVLYGDGVSEPWAIDGIGFVRNPQMGAFGHLLYPFSELSTSMFAYTAYLETVRETATSKIIYQSKNVWSGVEKVKIDNDRVQAIMRGSTLDITATSEIHQAELTDMAGLRVYHRTGIGDKSVSFDTQGLQSGLYIIRITTSDGNRIVQKTIIR